MLAGSPIVSVEWMHLVRLLLPFVSGLVQHKLCCGATVCEGAGCGGVVAACLCLCFEGRHRRAGAFLSSKLLQLQAPPVPVCDGSTTECSLWELYHVRKLLQDAFGYAQLPAAYRVEVELVLFSEYLVSPCRC